MSLDNPAEQLTHDISALQSDLSSLESKVRLADVRDAVENLDTTVSGLAQRVKDNRAKGYPFEKNLEEKASDFATRWAGTHTTVSQQIDQQANLLQADMRNIESQMTQLNSWSNNFALAQPMVPQTKSAVQTLQNKADAAANSITGMTDAFKKEVDLFTAHLTDIEWMLGQLAGASFQLLPSESGIDAVSAVWCQHGKQTKDDPAGVLYLTDQRILFEQKQEIATKKFLFVTTETQQVQRLALEVPVSKVESVKGSKQGLLGHEDHLDVDFASGAPTRSAHFHLNGRDCNVWQGLIGRAKSHDFDHDRAVAMDSAAEAKVKTAPTQCPNCGGAITQTILRGMDSIRCEFCGTVIRL